MLLCGELNHFTIYFGKEKNTIYCTTTVKETNGENLVYQNRNGNSADNLVALKLYQSDQTIPLLLNRECYFEVDSRPNPIWGCYEVNNLFTKEEFEAEFSEQGFPISSIRSAKRVRLQGNLVNYIIFLYILFRSK